MTQFLIPNGALDLTLSRRKHRLHAPLVKNVMSPWIEEHPKLEENLPVNPAQTEPRRVKFQRLSA